MDTKPNDVLRIDIDAVLRAKAPSYHRYIPKWLIRKLAKVICQDDLNRMLEANAGKRGSDFARGVLDHLNIRVEYHGVENIPADNPRVLIVSNHPLGGLDGMVYIDFFQRFYGKKPYFVVNDLLMAVEPLREVFVPVNKHGRQSRESLKALDAALASDSPVIIFPAGLVSRRSADGGIADLKWQKMFVNKAREFQRHIVPAFFSGENSPFFYNFAKRRKSLGLKFNVEMIYLPREVFRNRDARFDITFLPPIAPDQLSQGRSAQQWADDIRAMVYEAGASLGE